MCLILIFVFIKLKLGLNISQHSNCSLLGTLYLQLCVWAPDDQKRVAISPPNLKSLFIWPDIDVHVVKASLWRNWSTEIGLPQVVHGHLYVIWVGNGGKDHCFCRKWHLDFKICRSFSNNAIVLIINHVLICFLAQNLAISRCNLPCMS